MLVRSSTSHNLTISANASNMTAGGGLAVPSPKFAEANATAKSISMSPKKEFTLRPMA